MVSVLGASTHLYASDATQGGRGMIEAFFLRPCNPCKRRNFVYKCRGAKVRKIPPKVNVCVSQEGVAASNQYSFVAGNGERQQVW